MMRKIAILVATFGLLGSNANAQIESWYGVDLGRIGYRYNNLKMNTTWYTNNNFTTAELYGDSAKLSIGSVDLSAEVYGKNAYFFLDASLIPNFIQGAIQKKKLAEKTALSPQGSLDIAEMLPIRLAFGGPVTDDFAIYAGGQWMYSVFLTEGVAGRPVIVGGNQRGAGLHLVYGTDKILVRYSFMYDWIRRTKREYKGIATTNEVSVAVPLVPESKFGLIFRAAHRFRGMEDGYMYAAKDYNEVGDDLMFVPKLQVSDFFFTVGIYMEGLFSGTTRTVSESTYELYK